MIQLRYNLARRFSVIAVVLLAWLSSTTANARSEEKQESHSSHVRSSAKTLTIPASVLPPGGNTIGGPGFYDGEPGGGGAYEGPNTDICITVINRGSAIVNIVTAPRASFDGLVFPNETETRCATVESIGLFCDGGASVCASFWRVDRLP